MLRHAVLTAAGVVALGLPAAAPAAPASLPPVQRTLTAATSRCDRTAYTAPISGFLNVRLGAASGDWDLLVRDAATGAPLKSSRGFGGRELVQGFVTAGQRLVAQGCQRGTAAPTADVSFELVDVAPPAAGATQSLVRVRAGRAQAARLEERGFDVTENVRDGHADIVIDAPAQLDALRRDGLDPVTRIADMRASYADARRADAAYALRVDNRSPLPSGRTSYRTLDDIQVELKRLVTDHPDRVRRVTIGTTFQGRSIDGVEIADDVNGQDGRPVFFLMGEHHAREWPSAEAAMEFAQLMADGGDGRVASLLEHERVVIVPVVNVDGYVASREAAAMDPADGIRDANGGQEPDPLGTGLPLSTVESIAPPGGALSYRRKNCDGAIPDGNVPCALQHGIDNNRNYGNLWGGSGSSPDPTSQSFHGPGPRSEPETQAVWNFTRTHQVTMLMTLHNVAALVLRPPGLAQSGQAPDEARLKAVGDAMGAATGYTSQYSFQLYDTAGTTEDDTYAATGGFGYTIEIGPAGGAFHMPYETGVVDEWTGAHANGGGGLHEALLLAAEEAAYAPDHAILTGTAPAGSVLRLHKAFVTDTSPYCALGADPVITLAGGPVCAGPEQPPQHLDDTLDSTTVVPAGGSFEWHVNPSTRPFVGGGAVFEQLDAQPYETQSSPATADNRVPFEVGAADADGAVKVTLTPEIAAEDYDLEVYRVVNGQETKVGSSGRAPGAANEEVVLSKPEPGSYVAKVIDFTAVSHRWSLTVDHFKTTRTVSTGHQEAYTLTCESPQGKVLERRDLVIDRGQTVDLALGCGAVVVGGPPEDSGGGGGGGGGGAGPVADGAVADEQTSAPPADAPALQPSTAASTAAPRPGVVTKAPAPRASSKHAAAVRKARARCVSKARTLKGAAKRRAALGRCARIT